MEAKITIENVRNKFKEETGKEAILTMIKEGAYRTGYPKKIITQNYNPDYTKWLETFLVKHSV